MMILAREHGLNDIKSMLLTRARRAAGTRWSQQHALEIKIACASISFYEAKCTSRSELPSVVARCPRTALTRIAPSRFHFILGDSLQRCTGSTA
jgi:hypothetical protein